SACGQPPRGGRASPSPACSETRVIITRCLPTCAPFSPVLHVRVYIPFASVLPTEPGPGAMSRPSAIGWKLTGAPTSGLLLRVTLPDTGTIFFPPQPIAIRANRPSANQVRMVRFLTNGVWSENLVRDGAAGGPRECGHSQPSPETSRAQKFGITSPP